MASLGSYLPSPGKVAWRLDAASGDVTEGNKVRHVMIRSAQVWEKPTPHVMYKIEVLTENDQWYLYRRFSQFYSLHRKLMKLHAVSRDLLPPKRYHGNLSKQLIDQRRLQLEDYLQKLIHSEAVIAQSTELLEFLDAPAHDIVKVTDILTRHLYHHGDDLLRQAKPVALSVNEMYSITKRLRLPFDATGVDTKDPAADPANLYSFLHQLLSLRICLPPAPTSVCCMPFELSHFRSLKSLKLDKVPLSQAQGLLSLQQQIKKLSVARSIRTIRELLIESVEERRTGGSPVLQGRRGSGVEKWRVTATAKLTENRVVVQPWHALQTLVLSHNKITHLDDSLQILPVLTELNLSHNLIQLLELSFLCCPTLERLNMSHNAISKINDDKKVLETVTSLNLSHNRLHSLKGITSFVSVATLNLSYNLVGSRKDLSRLMSLRKLRTLGLMGNPVAAAQSSRLLLLAQFMHKSREIQLDGQELSEREKNKVHTYTERYGNDPGNWPMAQSLISQPDSSTSSGNTTDESESCDADAQSRTHELSGRSLPMVTGREKPKKGESEVKKLLKGREVKGSCLSSSLPLEVTWQVHAPGDYKGSPISRLSRKNRPSSAESSSEGYGFSSTCSFLTTQLHQGQNAFLDESTEEGYAVGSLRSDLSPLTLSREEPDGQSERTEMTPPTGLHCVPG